MKKKIITILLAFILTFAGTGVVAFGESTIDSANLNEDVSLDDNKSDNTVLDESQNQDDMESKDNEVSDVDSGLISMNQTVDGVTVTVRADAGVFPEGSSLSVTKIEPTESSDEIVDGSVESEIPNQDESIKSEIQTVDEVINEVDTVRSNINPEKNVAQSILFDVNVHDQDGNEIEPDTSKGTVNISFTSDQVANQNLDADVYHVKENGDSFEVQELPLEQTAADTVSTQTDGFSYYVFELTYDSKTYNLVGQDKVKVQDIVNTVGLSGEVDSATSDDTACFDVTTESSILYVSPLKTFPTPVNLHVKLKNDSTDYVIAVSVDLAEVIISWDIQTGNFQISPDKYTWDPEKLTYVRTDHKTSVDNSAAGTQSAMARITVTNQSDSDYYYQISYVPVLDDHKGWSKETLETESDASSGVLSKAGTTTVNYLSSINLTSYQSDSYSNPDLIQLGTYTINLNEAGSVSYTMTADAAGGKILTSADLLASETITDGIISYMDSETSKTVYAYNGFIPNTSGANWYDANNFVKALNENGVKPADSTKYGTSGSWRLLKSSDEFKNWLAASGADDATYKFSSYPATFGDRVRTFYSSKAGSDYAYVWRCGFKSPWQKFTKTWNRNDFGFVVVWMPN